MTQYVKPITPEILGGRLAYCPETGQITWVKHFFKRLIGRPAGTIGKRDGYLWVKLDYKRYPAARIAWVLAHGSIDDTLEIDHINRNRTNNKLGNLRLVTRVENSNNSATRLGEPCARGYTKLPSGKFQAQRRGKHIGVFDTAEEAKKAFYGAAA